VRCYFIAVSGRRRSWPLRDCNVR